MSNENEASNHIDLIICSNVILTLPYFAVKHLKDVETILWPPPTCKSLKIVLYCRTRLICWCWTSGPWRSGLRRGWSQVFTMRGCNILRGTKARTTIIFTITRMTAWSTGRCNPAGLARYNSVLLYDRDGASVGNLRCLSTEKL